MFGHAGVGLVLEIKNIFSKVQPKVPFGQNILTFLVVDQSHLADIKKHVPNHLVLANFYKKK